ncbi:MAG: SH3 domain-containing protein [Clostridia bacterium]|nr:SH3 domain-containing protein [Clostridia bacterium]
MAYCKNCGNYCGDSDCKFCPNCGTTMGEQELVPQKGKNKISKFAIVYLLVSLFVVAVVIALFIGKSSAKKDVDSTESTETTQVVSTTGVTQAETEKETESETVKESVSVSQEIVVVTVPVQQSYYPAGNWSWDYSNPELRFITYDTPGHAGVKLRAEPVDESAYSMVLPEGTKVIRVNAANETYNTKYIKVVALVNGNAYMGYVMQRYVSAYTDSDYNYNSGSVYNYRISYDTPSHAGVVLRAGSSGYSEKLMVIPEGTSVRVLDSSTGAYWKAEVLYNGGVYTGYILGKYIEYVG